MGCKMTNRTRSIVVGLIRDVRYERECRERRRSCRQLLSSASQLASRQHSAVAVIRRNHPARCPDPFKDRLYAI